MLMDIFSHWKEYFVSKLQYWIFASKHFTKDMLPFDFDMWTIDDNATIHFLENLQCMKIHGIFCCDTFVQMKVCEAIVLLGATCTWTKLFSGHSKWRAWWSYQTHIIHPINHLLTHSILSPSYNHLLYITHSLTHSIICTLILSLALFLLFLFCFV